MCNYIDNTIVVQQSINLAFIEICLKCLILILSLFIRTFLTLFLPSLKCELHFDFNYDDFLSFLTNSITSDNILSLTSDFIMTF